MRQRTCYLLIIALLVSLAAPMTNLASCSPQNTTYVQNSGNCADCGQDFTGLTYATDVIAKYWILDQYAAYNSGTLDKGMFQVLSGNVRYVYSTWTEASTVGCPYGATSGTRCIQVTSTRNGYILQSIAWATGTDYDFDLINYHTISPTAIPSLAVNGTITWDATNYYIPIGWTAITNLKGYYTGTAPTNLITGIRIRYAVAASAPARDLSNWTGVGATVDVSGASTSDPGSATVTIPRSAIPSGGNPAWLAMSLVFDDGDYETQFVGPASTFEIGPTASGVFAASSAALSGTDVTVSWRSNVESKVVSYEVYWSQLRPVSYSLVPGATVSPKGDNQSYSVTFKNPSLRRQGIYVKVRAVKSDGTFEESPVIKVGARTEGAGDTPSDVR